MLLCWKAVGFVFLRTHCSVGLYKMLAFQNNGKTFVAMLACDCSRECCLKFRATLCLILHYRCTFMFSTFTSPAWHVYNNSVKVRIVEERGARASGECEECMCNTNGVICSLGVWFSSRQYTGRHLCTRVFLAVAKFVCVGTSWCQFLTCTRWRLCKLYIQMNWRVLLFPAPRRKHMRWGRFVRQCVILCAGLLRR